MVHFLTGHLGIGRREGGIQTMTETGHFLSLPQGVTNHPGPLPPLDAHRVQTFTGRHSGGFSGFSDVRLPLRPTTVSLVEPSAFLRVERGPDLHPAGGLRNDYIRNPDPESEISYRGKSRKYAPDELQGSCDTPRPLKTHSKVTDEAKRWP